MATFAELYGRTLKYSVSSDTVSAKGFVNDAYREIVGRVALQVVQATKSLTNGVSSYVITASPLSISDLLAIQHIYYISSGQSQPNRMELISLEKLLEFRSFQQAISEPGLYYALNGVNNLEIYPAAITGDQIVINYVQAPTALSADGDLPASVPSEYQWLIGMRAGMLQSDYEDPESGTSESLEAKYERNISALKAWMRDRQGDQTRKSNYGYINRRGWIRHDNSTYYSGDS